MKRLAALMLFSLLSFSCSSKTIPSHPLTSNVLNIVWPYLYAEIGDNGVQSAFAEIADADGPVTNAAVTVSYNGGSQGLTFTGTYSSPITVNGAVVLFVLQAGYYSPVTYTPGQPCTLTAAFDGKTYTNSVTTLGGLSFTPGSGALVVSWAGGGTSNQIIGTCLSVTADPVTFGPPLVSPLTIPNTSLPDYSPGRYSLYAYMSATVPFAGIQNDSYFGTFVTDIVGY